MNNTENFYNEYLRYKRNKNRQLSRIKDEYDLARYLKRNLVRGEREDIKNYDENAIKYVGNTYPIYHSEAFNVCNDFNLLKKICLSLGFYIDYICDTPLYRSDKYKTREHVLVYRSKRDLL